MLIILILMTSIPLSALLWNQTRMGVWRLVNQVARIWLFAEIIVICVFAVKAFHGQGLFVIGRSSIVDMIYRVRLTYSHYLTVDRKDRFWMVDPDLGYTVGKDKKMGHYSTNSLGSRGPREYSLDKPAHTFRVVTVGDSFTFCDDEKDSVTWQTKMEEKVPNLEVINLGVSGYGFFQSVARLQKDGLKLAPDLVILGKRDGFYERDLNNYLTKADMDLKATDLYRTRFFLKDGKLTGRAETIFDFFKPEWRKKYLYDLLAKYNAPAFLYPGWTDFSHILILIKLVALNRYPALERQTLEEYRKNHEIDPDLRATNLAAFHYLRELAEKQGFTIVFSDGEPADDMHLKSDSFIRYFSAHLITDEQMKKLGKTDKDYINFSRHYNEYGNSVYGDTMLAYIKQNVWISGNNKISYNATKNEFAFATIKN